MSKKQVLFLAVFVIALFGFLYWIKESDFVAKKTRAIAKVKMEEALRQPADIESATLTLLPPSITLNGIATGGTSPLHIKAVRISFSLWSLLTKSFVIQEILIQNPTLSLGKDLPFLPKNDKKSSVVIRRIRIEEGTFSYNVDGEQEITLPHLQLSIRPNLTMDRFEVTVLGGGGRLALKGIQKAINRFEGKGTFHPEGVEIKLARGLFDKTHLEAKGSYLFSEATAPGINIKINATAPIEEYLSSFPATQTLSGRVSLEGHLTGTPTDPHLTGNISLPHLFAQKNEIGSLTTDFSYDKQKGAFKNTLAKLFSGEVSGEAEMHFMEGATPLKTPQYGLKLKYDRIVMNQALKPFFGSGKNDLLNGVILKGNLFLSGGKGAPIETITAMGETEFKRGIATPAGITTEESPAMAMDKTTPPSTLPRLLNLLEEGRFQWRWSDGTWLIQEAEVAFIGGKAAFQGTWSPKNGLALTTRIDSEEIKAVADAIAFPLTGRLHWEGEISGTQDRPSLTGRLDLTDWTLKQHPFGPLQTRLLYQDKTLTFQEGSLKGIAEDRSVPISTSPLYQFGGAIQFTETPIYHFTSELYSVDPQETLTFFNVSIPLKTAATGTLSIDGEGKNFMVTGPLTVASGSLYGEPFERGKLRLIVTEKEVRLRKVVLEKKDVTVEGEGEISYKGTYEITAKATSLPIQDIALLQSHHETLAGNLTLNVHGKGSFKKPRLNALIIAEGLRYQQMEIGDGTVRVSWDESDQCGPNHQTPPPGGAAPLPCGINLAMTFPQKNVSLTGAVSREKPYPFSFETRFDQLEIDPFLKDRLPASLTGLLLQAGGAISGHGTFSQLDQINLTGRLTQLSARMEKYALANDGPVTFRVNEGTIALETATFKGENAVFSLAGGLTPLKKWGLNLKGDADLDLLSLFTHKIRSGTGRAHLDIRITEDWKDPRISGLLSLQDGALRIGEMAQPVTIDSLSVVFNKRLLILERVEGRLGRGRVVGEGKMVLSGFDFSTFGFQFDLFGMPIDFLRDFPLVADGTLLFQGDANGQQLGGEVHLVKGAYENRIDLRDLVRRWRERQEEPLPLEIPIIGATRLNIHLYGKDNIVIRNNVAKVPLDVDLLMKGTLEKPLLFGQIDLPSGLFYFRANEFKVTSGTVQFLDPEKIDPVFDIRGRSKVQGYAVDMSLVGTISQSNLTLTAFPSLSQPDILSLLAVGKITSEITQAGDEAATFIVADVVSGYLAEPVKEWTGFDRISVGASPKSSKNTLVSAEKRVLNEKLLVVYSTAIDASEEQRIQVFYDLRKNTSLVGERDENGRIGGDLKFRFEFE